MYKSECEAKVVNQKTPSRWSHVTLLVLHDSDVSPSLDMRI